MAFEPNPKIIDTVKRYINEIEKNDIHILKAIIFGSYVKGKVKPESDIDVALISSSFTGDKFEDRRKIVPLRRNIDSRIEPIPFTPKDFNNSKLLAEEIKRTGIIINL